MRFPRISRLVASASLTTALGILAGCDGMRGQNFDPNRNFLDPSEVTRARNAPLLVPILDHLNTGIEEPNQEFTNATEVKPDDLVVNRTDYAIGRNDLIQVGITDLVQPGLETINTKRVSESGNISLPLVGQVQAAGYTESQLEQVISNKYKDANILPNAQVTVTVVEARNRTFSIFGSVGAVGEYQMIKADFRLLDALVLARGIQVQGIDYIYVVRRGTDDTPAPAPIPGGPGAGGPGAGGPGGASGPGTAPGTQPTAPGDLLTPRGDAGGVKRDVAYLVQDMGAASQPAAANSAASTTDRTAPTTTGTGTGDTEGRYIIVDGKPQLVNAPRSAPGTGATGAAGAAGAGTSAAGAGAAGAGMGTATREPMTAPPPTQIQPNTPTPAPAPAANPQGGFAFNDLKEPGDLRVIRVPYTPLKNGELKYNIVIRPNDQIIVPDPVIGEYYMGGHVGRVGVYSLTGRRISLTQAVISAGMLDQLAVPGRTQITRRIGLDRQVHCRVDLDKIFAGEEPDLFLKPDDQVTVGTNAISPFLAAIRGGFRMTYGFGFLYDRNFASEQNNKGL